jgi:hypothetical protein
MSTDNQAIYWVKEPHYVVIQSRESQLTKQQK